MLKRFARPTVKSVCIVNIVTHCLQKKGDHFVLDLDLGLCSIQKEIGCNVRWKIFALIEERRPVRSTAYY